MPSTKSSATAAWIAVMPGVFVVLWSTGFIGAKYGLPYAEPFTFLLVRFSVLIVVLSLAALIFRAPWPSTPRAALHIAIAGLLVHGVYLGGVFASIHHGVPAGVSALIVGVQPLLTAIAAGPFLGERVSGRQWAGFALGLAGVVMVVGEKVDLSGDLSGVGLSVLALFGITAGTLYQKRHGGEMPLRTGSIIQFGASAVLMAVLALVFETSQIQWTGDFVFALLWLVVVLSLGAISLLMIMIKRGQASKVASLFYLVPPVTAFIAYLMFDETLGWAAISGFALAVGGVAMVTKGR